MKYFVSLHVFTPAPHSLVKEHQRRCVSRYIILMEPNASCVRSFVFLFFFFPLPEKEAFIAHSISLRVSFSIRFAHYIDCFSSGLSPCAVCTLLFGVDYYCHNYFLGLAPCQGVQTLKRSERWTTTDNNKWNNSYLMSMTINDDPEQSSHLWISIEHGHWTFLSITFMCS